MTIELTIRLTPAVKSQDSFLRFKRVWKP
jgi:hypothetical protein